MTTTTPASVHSGESASAAGDDRGLEPSTTDPTIDATTAQNLWDGLIRARADSPTISAAEDAVFRFYLPLAKALARGAVGWAMDPELSEQAAELGLAKAVLAWRRPDCAAFISFARALMQSQIRQFSLLGSPLPRP